MIPANDIHARQNEIKNYIAAGDMEQAVKRFIDFAQDFDREYANDAILYSKRFQDLRRKDNLKLIGFDDKTLEENNIAFALLAATDDIVKKLTDTAAEATAAGSVIGDRAQLEALLAEQLRARETPDDLVLSAENITKQYRASKFSLQLDRLELRLGQITGLVGENATGKTTLLRILAGDLAHDAGVLHYPLFDPQNRRSWPAIKQQIAYVPQELPRWHGSLLENLRFEAALHGVRGASNREAVEYILQRMGLSEHVEKTWDELSGGYKLRFALAKALVWKAQLLLLDEPLAYLDVKTQLIVLNDLRNLSKSLRHPLAILVSSQHLHEIEAVADQMLFMRAGKLENLGATAALGEGRVQNVFELGCALPYNEFVQGLAGFPHHKVWSNGMAYFVSTALDRSGPQLLQHFAAQNITIHYYRDISRSIKTKFYETLV